MGVEPRPHLLRAHGALRHGQEKHHERLAPADRQVADGLRQPLLELLPAIGLENLPPLAVGELGGEPQERVSRFHAGCPTRGVRLLGMDSGKAFHSLASGIDYPMFIVTTMAGTEPSGCLVGFVTQGSINPIRLVVMLSKSNHTYRVALRASQLVVHFLHRGNLELSELFGEETGDQTDKFARCRWHHVDGVAPPVLLGTRGWAAGPVLSRFDAGDHMGHVVDVTAAAVDSDGPQLGFQMVNSMQPGHPA